MSIRQVVMRQTSLRFVIYYAAYGIEKLFILVFSKLPSLVCTLYNLQCSKRLKISSIEKVKYIGSIYLSAIPTLTDLNPGFGEPRDMLVILLVNAIFITLQKKSFSQKN